MLLFFFHDNATYLKITNEKYLRTIISIIASSDYQLFRSRVHGLVVTTSDGEYSEQNLILINLGFLLKSKENLFVRCFWTSEINDEQVGFSEKHRLKISSCIQCDFHTLSFVQLITD